MFDAISPRYDLLNHLLSGGIDRRWRAVVAARVREALDREHRPEARRILDVCTGTGDLALALLDARTQACDGAPSGTPSLEIVGIDFSRPMLARALAKSRRGTRPRTPRLGASDALRLPFRDGTFDACTIAFGLRNLVDPAGGVREMARVLRPGGRLFVLEFGTPRLPGIRQAYHFYFRYLVPAIGGAISGDDDAYRYLPRTVAAFPDRERLVAVLQGAGLETVSFRPLTFGIALLYEGQKPVTSRRSGV
jgi:demethylmenaquinone methyltransferase/2-methoxy-6-polyprenyl-1,4-benzoquinol methylase